MTIRTSGTGSGPDPASHATHDQTLIAALAAGDLILPEHERAASLRSTCPACRELHDDLLAIATATHHLPAPARPAALDFRISPERASALGRGSIWRRLLRPFGRSGSGTVRPLAAALTTIGFAGLMLAALPSIQLGSGSAALLAAPTGQETPADAQAPTFEPEVVPGAATAVPTERDTAGGDSTIDTNSGYGPADPTGDDMGAIATPAASDQGGKNDGVGGSEGDGRTAGVTGGPGGPTPLVILSLGFLGAGLGLFVVRRIALRLS
jgi:hypothetical protein